MHLLSVSWTCIWSRYCTRALALLYNVSLEALKSYAFAKSLGFVSQDLNSSQRHDFIASNILKLSKDLVPPEDWKALEQLVISRLAYYYILKRRNEVKTCEHFQINFVYAANYENYDETED